MVAGSLVLPDRVDEMFYSKVVILVFWSDQSLCVLSVEL